LQEAPQIVVFPQVEVDKFESKCYQVHVFLVPKATENEFKTPSDTDDVFDHPNYAGSRSIFGRGAECENCRIRPPYDIVIDVTHKLRDLQLSRYDAAVKVLLVETTSSDNAFVESAQTPLPDPLLTGPLFEDSKGELTQTNRESQSSDEVAALQRYLKRFGYYDDEVDGDFGPVTNQAVQDFQEASGLKPTGVVDAATKHAITSMKRCSNVDPFAKNNIKDEKSASVDYGDKYDLTYSVGESPGYLDRSKVLDCIANTVKQWSDACAVTLTYVDGADEKSNDSDIWIEWSDKTLHRENVLRFDGAGGVLGEGGHGFVLLDSAERWVIGIDEHLEKSKDVSDLNDPNTWYRGQPTISLYHTAPYYAPHKTTLTEVDKRIAVDGWGESRKKT
ncbi:NLP/P60 protein, partial [Reticulomyxa filosa]